MIPEYLSILSIRTWTTEEESIGLNGLLAVPKIQ